jgi:hypothetical protein
MRPDKERRKYKRQEYRVGVSAAWSDGQDSRFAVGKLHDISDIGAQFLSATAIPRGSLVFLQVPDLRLSVHARARYCERVGSGYRIGVEFTGPVQRRN